MKTLKKSIREVQESSCQLSPREQTFQLKYLKKHKIDFNVYLESREMNLQRDYVWTLQQKRELIYSVIIGRHIPHIAILAACTKNWESIYQVIDGKQRISTLFDFLDDKFSIVLEGQEFLLSEVPKDYQSNINMIALRAYVVVES